MSTVLGISAYHQDAAAALVRDGRIVAAAKEESFSRVKHDPRFPKGAINYCLGEAFIETSELDAVVLYDRPELSLDRAAKSALRVPPAIRGSVVAAMSALVGDQAKVTLEIEGILGHIPTLHFARHPVAHASSCFYPSPYDDAAILVVDGLGEEAACTLGMGQKTRIELIDQPHSEYALGTLYSAFASFCGFDVNSDEYKFLSLAPYGEPRFVDTIRDELVDIREDGSFRLHADAAAFIVAPDATSDRFDAIFGGGARAPEARIGARETDIAASVQAVAEDIALRLITRLMQNTGQHSLTIAGDVALSCVANGRVLHQAGLEKVFIQPAYGGAGGALGAALYGAHEVFDSPRRDSGSGDALSGSLLGPGFSTHEVEAFVDRHDVPSHRVQDERERWQAVAKALGDGAIVGLFSGRMEFGPRGLGARSILADPRQPEVQRELNLDVGRRERFDPCSSAVLKSHAGACFELDYESPYKLFVAPVRAEYRRPVTPDQRIQQGDDESLLGRLNQTRGDFPAVMHVDYSARIQTVNGRANPAFRRLLEAFYELTGCPLVATMTFRAHGEPIVCTPEDAYRCFMNAKMDLLVLEDRLLWKREQPPRDRWRTDHDAD
jgi:carbamoyltransferase